MGPTKITITISHTIRVQPYEMIKPEVSMDFEVPEGTDLDEFYQEKYKEVKRFWNKLLYNHVFDLKNRNDIDNIYAYAKDLVTGKEIIPTFKQKPNKK